MPFQTAHAFAFSLATTLIWIKTEVISLPSGW